MDLSAQKEQFSDAYVRAVAAVAGFACSKPSVDDDGIDWTVSATGKMGTTRSPKLDIQLKCTSQDVLRDGHVHFALDVAEYARLRLDNVMVPRIMVVVVVPKDVSDWLTQSEEELAMHRCGYWESLRGRPEKPNTITVTVKIPRSQQFTVCSLDEMMNKISRGERL